MASTSAVHSPKDFTPEGLSTLTNMYHLATASLPRYVVKLVQLSPEHLMVVTIERLEGLRHSGAIPALILGRQWRKLLLDTGASHALVHLYFSSHMWGMASLLSAQGKRRLEISS
jgi:hypothetical protein